VFEDPRRGALELPGFTFDFETNELRGDAGDLVSLRPQCLAVLRCLASAAGRLVTKQELMATVWRDVVVTDDSLVQCITELRRALRDSEHRVVITEPRRGYRLRPLHDAPSSPAAPRGQESQVPEVRFTTAPDGVRLAYAVCGEGPPLVRAARWMSHVELEWTCLTEASLLRELCGRFTFLRHDMRGQGLSDRGVPPGGPTVRALDLKAVVDAAGFERFTLLALGLVGVSIAVRFARLIPERVERLIVVSGMARGVAMRGERSQPRENREAWLRLIGDNWEDDDPLARQMVTTRHYPGATKPQMDSYNELQRRACSAAGVVEVIVADAITDVSAELDQVPWPTLVIHNPANAIVPFDEGRLVAAGIPGARFRTIDSRNLFPLPGEAGFDELLRLIEGFVREGGEAQSMRATAAAAAATQSSRGAALRLIPDTPSGPASARRRG